MSTVVDDAPDRRHSAGAARRPRPKLPRFIRTFAIPIVLVWIAIVAFLNTAVPQLEEVGKLRAVSMSPERRARR